jgi:hypothetical protein
MKKARTGRNFSRVTNDFYGKIITEFRFFYKKNFLIE